VRKKFSPSPLSIFQPVPMTLIDPLWFFSSSGIKPIEQPKPIIRPPVAPPVDVPPPKKIRTESPVRANRMPGVAAQAGPAPSAPCVSALWVDKYKPSKFSDLVGNGGQISKLSSWLKFWSGSANPKAALLSGTAGIGKTTTARLVAEQCGFSIMEFNASDTRSKTAIDELTSGLATNKVLFGNQTTNVGGSVIGSKVVIVMDEVDGMAGGDRGGSGALIAMVKKSKLPVICICNDRQDSKVRSLANHCLDLRFAKPSRDEVAARAAIVCREEKMTVSHSELCQIAEAAGCDMRQVINQLQMVNVMLKGVPGGSVKSVIESGKDETLGPFDVVKGLFTSSVARTWSYQKRNELFFSDYDLIPLLVQQNYVRSVDKVTDPRVLPALQKASEYISLGDVISKAIHMDAHWNLLNEMGTVSTVAPSFACNNVLPFPDFPVWLGKQSTTGKNSRLLKELRTMVGSTATTTTRNLKLSGYADILYQTLVAQLAPGGTESIANTIKFIDEIGAPRDAIFEVLSETRMASQPDLYGQIDSKTKSALTRTYNAQSHMLKAGAATSDPKKAKAQISRGNSQESPEEEQEDDEDDNSDNDISTSLVKPKTGPKPKNKQRK
jgi:replication factor C subunit 1